MGVGSCSQAFLAQQVETGGWGRRCDSDRDVPCKGIMTRTKQLKGPAVGVRPAGEGGRDGQGVAARFWSLPGSWFFPSGERCQEPIACRGKGVSRGKGVRNQLPETPAPGRKSLFHRRRLPVYVGVVFSTEKPL